MGQDLSNLNMGSGQPGLTGTDGFLEVQQAGGPSQPAKVTGQPTKDSIEKAGELAAALYLQAMSNPLLIPPDDPNHILAIGQLAMDKICLQILDSWSKSLQEIAEAKKEADRRDALNPLLMEVHMTAALFLAVASIFIRAIFGTQVAEALNKITDGGNIEKAIATRFAAQLNQWADEGILKGYLMTIVDQLPSSVNLSEAQKTVLANQIQLMLLGSALAGLYKIDTKWIKSEDFMNVLAHPEIMKDSNATALATLIINILNELPEEARARMIRTLSIYMDTNPDLPTLFDLGQTTDIQMSILKSSPT